MIAKFIDCEIVRVDNLVGKKRRLLELLKEKRLALISGTVTKGLDASAPMKDSGFSWLGEAPAHWEVKRLKQLIRLGSSISYGIVQPGPHQEGGVPFIQTTDLVRGRLEVEKLQRTAVEIAAQYPNSKLSVGDVILGIRASVGDSAIVTPDLNGANLSRGIARIAPMDGIIPEFLCLCLQAKYVHAYWAVFPAGFYVSRGVY